MSVPNTSAVFTVWSTLTRLAKQVKFPHTNPPDLNADGVKVWFGDYDMPSPEQELSTERVVIAPAVQVPDEEWGPIGRGARQERFNCFLYVVTAIPGRTELQAAARLEALTAPLQRMLADTLTPAGSPPEFDPFPMWRIECGYVLPIVGASPNGAIGRAEIQVKCEFRINTEPAS